MRAIRRAFRRISKDKVHCEIEVLDALFDDDLSPLSRKKIEHLYEELNIIDRKLVQLSTLNTGLMIAGGVLFRSMPAMSNVAESYSHDHAKSIIILFAISFISAAFASLLSAVPGLVSAASISSRIIDDVRKIGVISVNKIEYINAAVKELIEVKLVRNRRYYQAILAAIPAQIITC